MHSSWGTVLLLAYSLSCPTLVGQVKVDFCMIMRQSVRTLWIIVMISSVAHSGQVYGKDGKCAGPISCFTSRTKQHGWKIPLIKCYDFKVDTALLAGHFWFWLVIFFLHDDCFGQNKFIFSISDITFNPLGPRPPVTARSFSLPRNPRPPGNGRLADAPY